MHVPVNMKKNFENLNNSKTLGTNNKRVSRTVSDLMRRLPILQQLNSSQATLVKLTPAWSKWLNHAVTEEKLSVDCIKGAQLGSIQHNTLTLNCSNAIVASQIKQQQQNLLDSIRHDGFTEIEKLTIRIKPSAHQYSMSKKADQQTKEDTTDYAIVSNTQRKLSSNSLQAIENCQKLVTNESLATSLAKLAKTLKSL